MTKAINAALPKRHGTPTSDMIKTYLDLERLPSGKFASNALILTLGMLTYNMLWWIGLAGDCFNTRSVALSLVIPGGSRPPGTREMATT